MALVGVTAIWSSVSGAVLDYLRPGMRVWVAVAGAVLVLVAVTELWRGRNDPAERGHGSKVGWLVALPICVAVTVGSGSLGVYAVGRNATYRDLPDAPTAFDLEQYVRTHSIGGQPVELTLVDFVAAVSTEEGRAVLAEHPVELVGFVSRDDETGAVNLTRFVISCCAADGAAVRVQLVSSEELPSDGTWLRVVGTVGAPARSEGGTEQPDPAIEVDTRQAIDEPELPYEVPVSRIR
jgi:uncharacterized repeat protein (TIGR03943 family)